MELKPNQELIKLLGEIEMFQEMSSEERSELASLMEQQSWDAGREIFREGEPGGRMLALAEGTVEVLKRRSHGTGSVVIARFDRGGVIGEMSLVDGLPRSATIVAVQEARGFLLSQDAFNDMISNRPILAIKFLKGLAKLLSIRLRNTSGWFADVF